MNSWETEKIRCNLYSSWPAGRWIQNQSAPRLHAFLKENLHTDLEAAKFCLPSAKAKTKRMARKSLALWLRSPSCLLQSVFRAEWALKAALFESRRRRYGYMCINGRAQRDTWLMVNTHCFPWQRSRADHQRERCWGCLDRRGWDASCNTQHHHINTALVISLMHITATSDGSIPYIKNTRARAPCMWSNNAFASSFLPALAACPQLWY